MDKKTLISNIAEACGDVSRSEVERILEALGGVASTALQNGEDLNLPGLGRFGTKQRAARTARNPRTGEPIQIPAKRVVAFKPAKALQEAVA